MYAILVTLLAKHVWIINNVLVAKIMNIFRMVVALVVLFMEIIAEPVINLAVRHVQLILLSDYQIVTVKLAKLDRLLIIIHVEIVNKTVCNVITLLLVHNVLIMDI